MSYNNYGLHFGGEPTPHCVDEECNLKSATKSKFKKEKIDDEVKGLITNLGSKMIEKAIKREEDIILEAVAKKDKELAGEAINNPEVLKGRLGQKEEEEVSGLFYTLDGEEILFRTQSDFEIDGNAYKTKLKYEFL